MAGHGVLDPAAADSFAWCAAARTELGQQRWSMLHLVYGSGLSQRQIADKLGLSRELVKSEIARSMQVVSEFVTAAA